MELNTKMVPIGDLHEDPANVRQHPTRNLNDIRNSLVEFGQVEPLVVQKGTGKVIGGNGRLSVMRDLGWEEAAVVEFDGTDLQCTALAIALNRTSDTSEFNTENLAHIVSQIMDEDNSLAHHLGFSESEIDDLLKQLGESEITVDTGDQDIGGFAEGDQFKDDTQYGVVIPLTLDHANDEELKADLNEFVGRWKLEYRIKPI